MRRISIGIIFFLLVLFPFPFVHADRGMIPVFPEVSVYEPGQKAIVAWNGQEEILILSTDVISSSETLVVELLPLPSKPEIEIASFQSFEEIQRLIWEEGLNRFMYSTKGEARSGSVEVVFHEKIGAHNITVVKAVDATELVDWIGNFLQANSVDKTVSLGDFESVVKDYMGRGFRYYALDLITVTSDEKSVDPILYKFNSSFLYYPLVITSPVPGETEIILFLLTEAQVNEDYQPMQKAYYRVVGEISKPIEFVLSKGELSKIDLRIGELFDDGAWLTVLKYDGNLSWLTRDLMITEEALNPAATVNVEITLPTTLIALCILLGAACTLIGVVCTLLIMRSKKEEAKTG
ncbi:hypothetical protein DRO59_04855 [Candidatus Bathyarchaeota archaeon]|nr:MAG: hypothetical protein DRO59_04855 [Candidatus Bathyarchaeota archaeon]